MRMVNLAATVLGRLPANRNRPTVSYKKRTGLTVMLPALQSSAIVSGYSYVSAALTFVALPVGRAGFSARVTCRSNVAAGTPEGVPRLLLLRFL